MIFSKIREVSGFQIVIVFFNTANAENKEDTSNGPESCDVSEDEEEEKEEHYESPKLLTKKDLKPGESQISKRSYDSTPERGFIISNSSRLLPATLIMKKPGLPTIVSPKLR